MSGFSCLQVWRAGRLASGHDDELLRRGGEAGVTATLPGMGERERVCVCVCVRGQIVSEKAMICWEREGGGGQWFVGLESTTTTTALISPSGTAPCCSLASSLTPAWESPDGKKHSTMRGQECALVFRPCIPYYYNLEQNPRGGQQQTARQILRENKGGY